MTLSHLFYRMNRSAKPETWQLANWTGVTWNSSMVAELKAHYDYASTHPALIVNCLGYKNFQYVSIMDLWSTG